MESQILWRIFSLRRFKSRDMRKRSTGSSLVMAQCQRVSKFSITLSRRQIVSLLTLERVPSGEWLQLIQASGGSFSSELTQSLQETILWPRDPSAKRACGSYSLCVSLRVLILSLRCFAQMVAPWSIEEWYCLSLLYWMPSNSINPRKQHFWVWPFQTIYFENSCTF